MLQGLSFPPHCLCICSHPLQEEVSLMMAGLIKALIYAHTRTLLGFVECSDKMEWINIEGTEYVTLLSLFLIVCLLPLGHKFLPGEMAQ